MAEAGFIKIGDLKYTAAKAMKTIFSKTRLIRSDILFAKNN